MIYESEQAYQAIRSTPEGKAYGDLHWEFFDKPRGSGSLVPEAYAGQIEDGKAYDILLSDADWKKGTGIFITSKIHGDVRPYLESLRNDFANKGLKSALVLIQGSILYEYQLWENSAALHSQWNHVRKAAAPSLKNWPSGTAEMKPSDWQHPELRPGHGLNILF